MENQRIRITKQMLKTALINILQHTELGKVKINMLCEKAQVNRTTFYKYYGSQYELLDDIENDILQDIADYIRKKDGASSIIKLLRYLEANRESCLVLINIRKNAFAMKIFNMEELEFMNQLFRDAGKDERQWKYIKNFVYNGCYSIIIDWLSSPQRESCEVVADLVVEMVARCIRVSKKELME